MVQTVTPQPVDVDALAMKVFLKALELAGGPRKLIEHRHLTWVPSLIEASYVMVLFNEAGKPAEEIARFLGVGEQTVRNILRASPEAVQARLHRMLSGEDSSGETRTHIAGGMAKLAYNQVKQEIRQASGQQDR